MSNTEQMVSVPCEELQRFIENAACLGRSPQWVKDKAALLNAIAKPAAQHQGEPVEALLLSDCVEHHHKGYGGGYFGTDIVMLYTHADPGEVEKSNKFAEIAAAQVVKLLAQLRDANEKIADRDALLRDKFSGIRKLAEQACGRPKDSPEYRSLLAAINPTMLLYLTALSASAEPSAPKCEDCSGTGSPGGRMHANGIDAPEYEPYKCEKCDGFGIVGNILNAETCTDCTPSTPVDRDELVPAALMLRQAGFGNLADAVDEARAALERKP